MRLLDVGLEWIFIDNFSVYKLWVKGIFKNAAIFLELKVQICLGKLYDDDD